MAEGKEEVKKKEFPKSKFLNFGEIKKLTNEYLTIKLHDMEVGSAFTAKIVGEPEVKEFDQGKINLLPIEYKAKELSEPVSLKVQAGDGAIKKLNEKNPDKSYIGKWAVFSKTKFEGKFPQFINVMKKEPQEFENKDEVFAKAEKNPEEVAKPIEKFEEFEQLYLEAIKEKGIEPELLHMIGTFVANNYGVAYKDLIDKCKKFISEQPISSKAEEVVK